MGRTYTIMAFTLLTLVAIAVLPGSLQAQTEKRFIDLRNQPYTEEDLAGALFPSAEPQTRIKGIGPQTTPLPGPPMKASVGLNVFFELNSATIRPEYYIDLDKLGHVLTRPQYAEKRIEIEGHTDSLGSVSYNRRLSERRAKSVRQCLVERFAINENRLVVRGYGEDQPIATNATPEGQGKNRRIEAVNLGQ